MRLKSPLWGYIIVMAAVLFLGVLIPAMLQGRHFAKRVVCGFKMECLANALFVHKDTLGKYPEPDLWADLIIKYPGDLVEDVFCCPTEPEGSFSYAMNAELFKLEPAEVPSQMVLLFEANLGQRNAIGGPGDLLLRHDAAGQPACNIAFADGHSELVTQDRIGQLQWTAD